MKATNYLAAISYRVNNGTAAVNSVTIGTGVINGLFFANAVPDSMTVVFNSNVPALLLVVMRM